MEQWWSIYLQEGGEPDPEQFGLWLIRNTARLRSGESEERPSAKKEKDPLEQVRRQMSREDMMAIFIGRLYRFAQMATKPIMQECGIDSQEEFAIIATLLFRPDMPKTQLLKQNLIEKARGSYTIQKLLSQDVLADVEDEQDRRVSRLRLTARGKRLFFRCVQELNRVEDIMAPLTAQQRQELYHLLDILDAYHSSKHEIRQVSRIMEQPDR